MASRLPGLSKTRFQAGLQCPKQLWLRCYRPELADSVSEAQQAIFDQGHRVGDLARRRFPGGTLVTEDHLHGAAALRTTEDRLSQGCRCLYEGALRHDGVLVRPDILVEEAGGWSLIEVKSTTEVKAEHHTDLAIQAYVLRGAGLHPGRSCLLHLNRGYVYPGGRYDLQQLFTLADLTAEVEALLPQIPGMLAELQECLLGPCPEPLVGRHCTTPYNCAFLGHCHSSLPKHPVTEIPRVSDEVLHGLLASGISCAADVPPFYPGLTPSQRTACQILRTGRPRIGAGLAGDLQELHPPLHFLDFETLMPALPLHPGTHPYHLLPVQWSCHTLRADGSLEHREFLHEADTDPRLPVARSLLQALSSDPGTIVVYHAHEERVLSSLAVDLPQLAPALHGLRERLFDLHRVIATHVQHPDFHGRTSLKHVLPALVNDLSYADLAIRDGQAAMLRYQTAVYGTVSEEERQHVFADLRAYCGMDTLALVRLLEVLSSLTPR